MNDKAVGTTSNYWRNHELPLDGDDYKSYEETFRRHYRNAYSDGMVGFDRLSPGYLYGYNLARDDRFKQVSWNEVAEEARRHWRTRDGETSWDEVKDAVQHAWREVVNSLSDTPETVEDRVNRPEARRFGRLLAEDLRYQKRDWEEIADVVRERWERDHPDDGKWEAVVEDIRHNWLTGLPQ